MKKKGLKKNWKALRKKSFHKLICSEIQIFRAKERAKKIKRIFELVQEKRAINQTNKSIKSK